MSFDPSPQEMSRWNGLILRVSRGVSKDFPDIETDDLYQDLWEDLLHEDYYVYLNEPWIKSYLSKRCRVVAWERRKENLQWSSQYSYRPSDIRTMLQTVFRQEDWDRIFLPSDASEEERRSARLDVAVDLSWALDQLPDHYFQIIENRYANLVYYDKDSAESKMLYRAELRLTEILNTYRGGQTIPRRRRTISNAHAMYTLQEQNGD